jgi:regulator of RNase E activity RraA
MDDERILHRLQELHAAALSDGLKGRNVMAAYIKAIIPGKTLIGPAYTVRPVPGDHLTVVKAMVEAPPGSVLVIDDVGCTEVAMAGEMMCTFAKKQGVVGMVIDGAVRDVAGIRGLDFQVFCRAITCRSAVEESLGQVQVPIACGGVAVRPGDWIFGDDDGVVVVPLECLEEVIQGAIASEKIDDALRGGADFMSFLGMDKILAAKEAKAKEQAQAHSAAQTEP